MPAILPERKQYLVPVIGMTALVITSLTAKIKPDYRSEDRSQRRLQLVRYRRLEPKEQEGKDNKKGCEQKWKVIAKFEGRTLNKSLSSTNAACASRAIEV